MFGLHLLLAVGLAAFADALSPLGVLGAFALVYLVLRLGRELFGVRGYLVRLERGLGFVAWYALAVLEASRDVARIALRREVAPSPAVVAVKLASRDERLVTLVAALVTLTPGTLALDYDPETGEVFVHALNAATGDEVRQAVAELEGRLLAWLGRDKMEGSDHDG